MAEVRVNLKERSYVITIESGALARVGRITASVAGPSQVAVISNRTVARYYGEAVLSSLRSAGLRAQIVIIPGGERFKTLITVQRIYEALLDLRMDRRGVLVALGGGVVGDIVGFAAATYMRGIDSVQVPTTLLAQVDASIGGKTGVDLPRGKNLVGAFHQPRSVVIDISTLRTLPTRELRSGLAEVVKHGIIYDQDFYGSLDAHAEELLGRREDVLGQAIRRSVEIKRDVIQEDEREVGPRAILNYGHTVGHAIEVLTGYRQYRHGEAISIGMVTEALLAEREDIAPRGTAAAIARTLARLRLPVRMDASIGAAEVLRAAELDKKTTGGELRLALPARIGQCRVLAVSRKALAAAIEAHVAQSW